MGLALGIAAGIVASVAAIPLTVFFATWKDVYGRVNDAIYVAFMALVVPLSLSIYERFGALDRWWVGTVTVLLLVAGGAGAVGSALVATERLLCWRVELAPFRLTPSDYATAVSSLRARSSSNCIGL